MSYDVTMRTNMWEVVCIFGLHSLSRKDVRFPYGVAVLTNIREVCYVFGLHPASRKAVHFPFPSGQGRSASSMYVSYNERDDCGRYQIPRVGALASNPKLSSSIVREAFSCLCLSLILAFIVPRSLRCTDRGLPKHAAGEE